MYFSTKKTLESFPFDSLWECVASAMDEVTNEIIDAAKRTHNDKVDKLISKAYANREESFEGDREALYPFLPPDPAYIKENRVRIKKEAVSNFCKKYDVVSNSSWLLPQLAAHISKIPLTFTAEGKVDGANYLNKFNVDDFHRGLYTFCTHSLRGDMIQKQYLPENRNYSALVPLLLMPHKRFNNVLYSSWDTTYLDKLVDPNLYKALACEFENTLSNDELLIIRNAGLEYKSGKMIGKMRSAETSYKIYSVSGEVAKLPWLLQVMLFQIWCAHPVNRSDMMILDWKNWDSIPDPLVNTEVLLPTKTAFAAPILNKATQYKTTSIMD